ncbi:hypothetical protein [Actinocorallia populi]|uniref:hypothetical protein n=1 Tax=Actinocorallia populi TaxID=2079200 RepID=UPI000D091F6A|nr:hypothetical protein [Actinocorallia populi]
MQGADLLLSGQERGVSDGRRLLGGGPLAFRASRALGRCGGAVFGGLAGCVSGFKLGVAGGQCGCGLGG